MTDIKRRIPYLIRIIICTCLVMCIFVCPARAEAAQDGETVRVGYYENEILRVIEDLEL